MYLVKLDGNTVLDRETLSGLSYWYPELTTKYPSLKEQLAFLAKQNYYPLSDKPEHSVESLGDFNRFTHTPSFTEVKLTKGLAIPKWRLTPLTKEETTYITSCYVKSIRARRDQLLAESDWTQLSDVPEETKLKWRSYRQALRDLPNQFLQDYICEWPQLPS